jgi:hypothetical protein
MDRARESGYADYILNRLTAACMLFASACRLFAALAVSVAAALFSSVICATLST